MVRTDGKIKNGAREPGHCRGRQHVRSRCAVAHLAGGTAAPALHGACRHQRARMARTGHHLVDAAHHGRGCGCTRGERRGGTAAELAVRVVAPARRRPVRERHARELRPCRHAAHRAANGVGLRGRALVEARIGHCSQLSLQIVAPAVHRTAAGGDGAHVEITHLDICDRERRRDARHGSRCDTSACLRGAVADLALVVAAPAGEVRVTGEGARGAATGKNSRRSDAGTERYLNGIRLITCAESKLLETSFAPAPHRPVGGQHTRVVRTRSDLRCGATRTEPGRAHGHGAVGTREGGIAQLAEPVVAPAPHTGVIGDRARVRIARCDAVDCAQCTHRGRLHRHRKSDRGGNQHCNCDRMPPCHGGEVN